MSIFGHIFLKNCICHSLSIDSESTWFSIKSEVHRGTKVMAQFYSETFISKEMPKKGQKLSENKFLTVPVFRKTFILEKYNQKGSDLAQK